MIDSYDPQAHTPELGSRWVWEIDSPTARVLIEVVEVTWNGEEWWITTRSLLGGDAPLIPGVEGARHWNDLSRFAEAVTPVGAALPHTWVYRAVSAGTERNWTQDSPRSEAVGR